MVVAPGKLPEEELPRAINKSHVQVVVVRGELPREELPCAINKSH